ncbi:GNAT family N-acetyltransferase [Pseudomonas viridiflava]|uniref:GNAT family N-acetyltransferase n=1 Tax=Pseudomonas syringae group TaxID=136849 RepID=UPI0005B6E89D|nr:GNAT family N-acetyltransferase [Pseudomonas viridiflava]KIQ33770.1 acetyltransferase domain protein [Pseudomonas viridiflava]MEE4081979.1 GNAT family N-acetyltransferase [Pseudomonas viridiflava]MEE4228896.1 GNAT family N-acetyltransferase [Pseudomonas viridiflava]MEE4234754.1 GNAT family N-acetyltransferase [Pseudomonas viridiflava]
MSTTPTLQTERLLLTPLQLADAPAMQQLFPQWEIVRFLNNRVPWPYPEDGALRYIQDVALPASEQGTQWHWMIRLHTAPNDIIGSISLMTTPGNNRGFWLHPDWQGNGYMQEACVVINAFWFETLGQPVMQVPKAAPNGGSRRVSMKEGMRLVSTGESDYVSGRFAEEIWEMTREEWVGRRGSRTHEKE